jgi:hypothetical protein
LAGEYPDVDEWLVADIFRHNHYNLAEIRITLEESHKD